MTAAQEPPLKQVPLTGLLGIALEAMLAEFRGQLEQEGYGDIRPTHGCVFRFVHGDGMRLTDLSALAGMTKQSVGEVVDDLAERGYVERFPDPDDRRAKLIRLTAKGKEAQATGFGIFAAIEQRWAERFGPDRLADIRALLEEIAHAEAPEAVPELARPALAHAS
ncbi:MAG TPA: MarR family winged helix-turn-helix transcriptional regulator [Solirubrobacterales bacterium]|jgi:DNA-binding MarR family transcriptional regulator|nr:MarR family winged helix-turn-helix transcriptional regulator [Solirubrobacterales bacterium]